MTSEIFTVNAANPSVGDSNVNQLGRPTVAHGVTPTLPVSVPMNHAVAEKPEKFNGLNFKRWRSKMLFYLTTLNLTRFLTEESPKQPEGEQHMQSASAIEAWMHSDYLCRNYVLNNLSDFLYNEYCKKKTAKDLWESLDRKYQRENDGAKKFVLDRFLEYHMVDSKSVTSQVTEIQDILTEIHNEGMILSEAFQVAAIIEKLPPLWKEFKFYLKHKRKEENLKDLIIRFKAEEDNMAFTKRGYTLVGLKANIVEHGQKK